MTYAQRRTDRRDFKLALFSICDHNLKV
jgi:hypothetical protein